MYHPLPTTTSTLNQMVTHEPGKGAVDHRVPCRFLCQSLTWEDQSLSVSMTRQVRHSQTSYGRSNASYSHKEARRDGAGVSLGFSQPEEIRPIDTE